MTKIYKLDEIKQLVDGMDFLPAIEEGFVEYSKGRVVTPPVGELIFEDPPGDTHIKYGYIKQDDYFAIKVASGFYKNTDLGLPSSSGLMLLFSQKTGQLDTVLLDDGYLTNVRTAIAGAIAAKFMAPKNIHAIGVFGTGTMAKMQVGYLKSITSCNHVIACGRSDQSLQAYQECMEADGYEVHITQDSNEVTEQCNLIVMATPSQVPLIHCSQIRAGTHITAMGSDTAEKQELDPQILSLADVVVADSIDQCQQRGEIFHALASQKLQVDDVIELGSIIDSGVSARMSDKQITVIDLTGVAVQDIQIAKAVRQGLMNNG